MMKLNLTRLVWILDLIQNKGDFPWRSLFFVIHVMASVMLAFHYQPS